MKMKPMSGSTADKPRLPDVMNGIPVSQGMLVAAGMGMRKLDQELASRRASAFLVACQEALTQGLGMAMAARLNAQEMALVNLLSDVGVEFTPEEAEVILGRAIARAKENGVDLSDIQVTSERAALLLGCPTSVALACEYIGVMQRVDEETAVERAGTIRPVSGLMTLPVPKHRTGDPAAARPPVLVEPSSESGTEEL